MSLYYGYSDSHFQRRWELIPRHLIKRDTLPHRGMSGLAFCGADVRVTSDQYDPSATWPTCKNCLRRLPKETTA